MKRKMMSRESIPSKKTTNGGNGSYMRRAMVKDKDRGGHQMGAGMKARGTATGRPVLKAL